MSEKLWKLYAIVMCTVSIWSFSSSEPDVMSFGVTMFSVVGLIGLCGFAFNKGIGRAFMWKIYFGFSAIAVSAFAVFAIYGLVNHFELDLALDLGLVLGVQMPLFYALWAYAYKLKEVWQRDV